MRQAKIVFLIIVPGVFSLIALANAADQKVVYPTKEWQIRTPQQVALDPDKLKALSDFAGGFGCIVRHGYMVYTWGNPARRMDVASAVKPLYTHFLLKAIQDKKLRGFDEPIKKYEPKLQNLNSELDYKDRNITWRHLCNQISCYGVTDKPGSAYDYSDYNMALFFDTLMLKVYRTTWDKVDQDVFHPMLTDILQCQDNPTFMAFGTGNRPGRLGISPRDFARFGLLYLRKGKWNDKQLIDPKLVKLATTTPLPLSVPRTEGKKAEMIPDQRSIGGGSNQCDHCGSYSFAWWINGVRRDGKRNWPDVPSDVFSCLGHGDIRACVVLPSLDMVVCWNDTRIEGHEKVNQALRFVVQAAAGK